MTKQHPVLLILLLVCIVTVIYFYAVLYADLSTSNISLENFTYESGEIQQTLMKHLNETDFLGITVRFYN